MKRTDIEFVMRELGSEVFKESGEWLMTNCPLAPWTHDKGTDSNPSFGVREGVGISGTHCFSCGYKGGMMGLVREYAKYALKEYKLTEEDVQQLLDYVIVAEDDDEVQKKVEGKISEIVVPDGIKECLGMHHPYFEQRGINELTARMWGLGYVEEFFDKHTMSSMNERVLFPVLEKIGQRTELRGVTGRTLIDEQQKYKNCPPNLKKSQYLYGDWLKPDWVTKFIVVEGPIDTIKMNMLLAENQEIFKSEYWTVGLLGADPSKAQIEKLIDMAEEVIVMTDNDPSGKLGKKKLVEALSKHLVVSVVDWQVGVKDPDDAGDGVISMILNRKSVLEDKLSKLLGSGDNVEKA